MKRKTAVLIAGGILAAAMAFPAFAGQWRQDAAGWRWQNDDGSFPADGWQWLDGNQDGIAECYYFGSDGYMLVNAVTPDQFQVNESGAWIVNGAVQTRARESAPAVGWNRTEEGWKYYTGGRYLADEWKRVDGSDYYFDSAGVMAAGFHTINGDDYCFRPDGSLRKSSFTEDGVRYIVEEDGIISEVIDTFDVPDDSGIWYDYGEYGGRSDSGFSDSGSFYGGEPEEADVAEYAREVADLVNQEREKEGLDPLEWDESLAECSQMRAEEIVETFSHDRPDGTSWDTILDERGVDPGNAWGENIAMGQTDPADVMDSWMHSSGHKANILEKTYTRIGVGCCEEDGRFYWVQNFAGEW